MIFSIQYDKLHIYTYILKAYFFPFISRFNDIFNVCALITYNLFNNKKTNVFSIISFHRPFEMIHKMYHRFCY